jgi:hypothetical protein
MNTGYVYITGTVPNTTTSLSVGANSSTNYRWWVRSWCGSTQNSAYAGYLAFTTPSLRIDDTQYSDNSGNEPLFPSDETDEDGPVVKLEMNEVNLYPNPTATATTLSFYTPLDSKFVLTIADLSGKVIYMQTVDAATGFNLVDLDVAALSKGVYMVRLSGDSQSVNKRLSVQ